MWEKIKSMPVVFIRGAFSGIYGFVGAALIVFSIWLWAGFFMGVSNVQNYARNLSALDAADGRIAALRERLDRTELHIKLLQDHSPDFVAEMGLTHLNIGDPAVRVVKK